MRRVRRILRRPIYLIAVLPRKTRNYSNPAGGTFEFRIRLKRRTCRDEDNGIPVFKLHGSIDWLVAHRSESFSTLDLQFDELYKADFAVVAGFPMANFDAMAQMQFPQVARARLRETRPLPVTVVDRVANDSAKSRFRRVFRCVELRRQTHEDFDWICFG